MPRVRGRGGGRGRGRGRGRLTRQSDDSDSDGSPSTKRGRKLETIVGYIIANDKVEEEEQFSDNDDDFDFLSNPIRKYSVRKTKGEHIVLLSVASVQLLISSLDDEIRFL